jgi:hypothetical protein
VNALSIMKPCAAARMALASMFPHGLTHHDTNGQPLVLQKSRDITQQRRERETRRSERFRVTRQHRGRCEQQTHRVTSLS